MFKRVTLAAAVFAVLAAASVGATERPDVLRPFDARCQTHLSPCGPNVKLGSVDELGGPVKISARHFDAQRGKGGVCRTYSDYRYRSTYCPRGNPLPSNKAAIEAVEYSVTSGRPGVTNVYGTIRQKVRSIDLVFRRQGKLHERHAKFVRVAGSDLQMLGQSQKFGFFEGTMPGCVDIEGVRLRAKSKSGRVLGVQSLSGSRDYCSKLHGNGDTIFGVPR